MTRFPATLNVDFFMEQRLLMLCMLCVASHGDVRRGSSRVPAALTTFVGQERVANPNPERLRGRLCHVGLWFNFAL